MATELRTVYGCWLDTRRRSSFYFPVNFNFRASNTLHLLRTAVNLSIDNHVFHINYNQNVDLNWAYCETSKKQKIFPKVWILIPLYLRYATNEIVHTPKWNGSSFSLFSFWGYVLRPRHWNLMMQVVGIAELSHELHRGCWCWLGL